MANRTTNRASRMGLEHEELAGSVTALRAGVHKALGREFLESIYENALAELQPPGRLPVNTDSA